MNNTFGSIISYLRKEKGISQKQASSDLGISQALLSHYEKGIREPNNETLIKLAEYFDVSVDYLLGLTISRKPIDTLAFHSAPGYEKLNYEDRQYIDDLITRLNKKND